MKSLSCLYCCSRKHLKVFIQSFHGLPQKTLTISGMIGSSAWEEWTNNHITDYSFQHLPHLFVSPPLSSFYSPSLSPLISAAFNSRKSTAPNMKICIEGIVLRNIYKPICLTFSHHNYCCLFFLFIQLFLHPFPKSLLCIIPDIIPCTEDTPCSQLAKSLFSRNLLFSIVDSK